MGVQHHVPPFVGDDDPVVTPGLSVVARSPQRQVGRAAVATPIAEPGVDQAEPPVVQLDDVRFGVPRPPGTGCEDEQFLGCGQGWRRAA